MVGVIIGVLMGLLLARLADDETIGTCWETIFSTARALSVLSRSLNRPGCERGSRKTYFIELGAFVLSAPPIGCGPIIAGVLLFASKEENWRLIPNMRMRRNHQHRYTFMVSFQSCNHSEKFPWPRQNGRFLQKLQWHPFHHVEHYIFATGVL